MTVLVKRLSASAKDTRPRRPYPANDTETLPIGSSV